MHYFYTAGSRNGLEGVGERGYTHKKEVDPKKKKRFVMEQHIEDVTDQKTVPDLLESMLRSTDPVKE